MKIGKDGSQSVTEYVLGRTVEETETGLTFPFSEDGHGKKVREGPRGFGRTSRGVS